MFILDTNVISETFAPKPSAEMTTWMDAHRRESYWVTTISRAELLLGVLVLPEGSRRQKLFDFVDEFFRSTIRNEILPFGKEEADVFASLVVQRRRIGRPIGEFDAQIAAIARVRGFALVTRNVRDFEHCSVEIINPWDIGTA